MNFHLLRSFRFQVEKIQHYYSCCQLCIVEMANWLKIIHRIHFVMHFVERKIKIITICSNGMAICAPNVVEFISFCIFIAIEWRWQCGNWTCWSNCPTHSCWPPPTLAKCESRSDSSFSNHLKSMKTTIFVLFHCCWFVEYARQF